MSIVIGYLNRIRSAVLTGGSWLAAAPLTELQTRSRARCARSSNALTTSTQFDIDLGSAMACQGFAIPNHNASSAAQWRITAGTVPATLEFGGQVGIREKRVGTVWRPVGGRRPRPGQPTRVRMANYAPRPFMGPALEAERDKFPQLWARSISA